MPSAAAVFQLLRPDFKIAIFPDALAFAPERVLINRDYFFVGKNVVNLRPHIAQVVARYQRRGQHRPQAEVGSVLSVAHATVADFEHIRIVPVSRPGIG